MQGFVSRAGSLNQRLHSPEVAAQVEQAARLRADVDAAFTGPMLATLVVAFLLAYSAKSVGKTYNVLSKVEWWARMVTGWLFILVGVWFSLTYVFELRWSQ